jgi:hypothetical protein
VRPRLWTLVCASLVFGATLLLVPASQSLANPGDVWLFQRNSSDRTNSRFFLLNGLSTVASWRSGSGTNTDECDKANPQIGDYSGGWLPNGTYTVRGYSYNWPGTEIRGPVLWLTDKQCWNGTWRTELFVHSSYPWSAARYSSYGCIKVSNTGGPSPAYGDIRQVVDLHVARSQPATLVVQ